MGFADVRNHLTTGRLREIMGTDVFVFHGYSVLQIEESFGHMVTRSFYQAYCPMAFNDKGASWLQDSDRVLNPYFGSQMLRLEAK